MYSDMYIHSSTMYEEFNEENCSETIISISETKPNDEPVDDLC